MRVKMLKTIYKIITSKKYNSCFLILFALIATAIECYFSPPTGSSSINGTNIPVWLIIAILNLSVITPLDAAFEIVSAIYKKLK